MLKVKESTIHMHYYSADCQIYLWRLLLSKGKKTKQKYQPVQSFMT